MYKILCFYHSGDGTTIIRQFLLFMKLLTFCLFGLLMQVHATGFGQRVSIEAKGASLKQVLNQIQNQTNYDFIYNSSNIRQVNRLDYNVKDKELNDVLQEILSPLGLAYFIDNKTVMITKKSELSSVKIQQQYSSGYVNDDQGLPVPGAIVKIINSNVATSTDVNGFFRLPSANPEGTLSVTALGFQTVEILFKAGEELQIPFKVEEKMLSEVVVVGYGIQKR